MTGIFRQKTPANIFLLLIIGVLIKLPMFLEPHVPVTKPGDGILFRAILDALEPAGKKSPIIYSMLTFMHLVTIQILLIKILFKFQHQINILL